MIKVFLKCIFLLVFAFRTFIFDLGSVFRCLRSGLVALGLIQSQGLVRYNGLKRQYFPQCHLKCSFTAFLPLLDAQNEQRLYVSAAKT